MVHKESLALAEEWLEKAATTRSVLSDGVLSRRTILRYRDSVVGRAEQRKRFPQVPLLKWWAEQAPGEPIWAITLAQLEEWWHRPVRNGAGTDTKPASASEVNNRRSSSRNFLFWLDRRKRKDIDEDIKDWALPESEPTMVERRKLTLLNPLPDGVFLAMWAVADSVEVGHSNDDLNFIWLGLGAFCTQRIAEMAHLQPSQVDLKRHSMRFGAKRGKMRDVHYGELMADWRYLPHLQSLHLDWMERFEKLVRERLVDEKRWGVPWLLPFIEGEEGYATPADLNRFDKRWQRLLKGAGATPRQFTPHQLRSFAAMNMWRSGVTWERLVSEMGHDKGATTHAYIRFDAAYDKERRRNELKRAREAAEELDG